MVATEMRYYLVGSRELDGGAMVTASHNPKAYTGVKLVREGALALSGDAGIEDVRARDRGRAAGVDAGRRLGSRRSTSGTNTASMRSRSSTPSKVTPMKVVVDGGNGMAGPMVGPILEELPLELDEMYFTPDGEFPDHEPNPLLEENRRMIIDRVRSGGVDLGIAWDGDADRCFFIDGDGEFCDGDFICALLSRAALAKNPGAMILYDPRSSRAVPDTIAAAGGRSGALPRRARLLQGTDARGERGLRRRGLRPLLLPRLLERRLGDDPGAADARAALASKGAASPN